MRRGTQYATTPPADERVHLDDLAGKDARWLNRAVGVSMTSLHSFPMGAVAISGGSVLGWSVNKYRNSPALVDWEHCSIHAEQGLMNKVDVSGATVYVARTTVLGDPALAKPCKHCTHALTAAGARRVVWTAGNFHAEWMNLG
jgi:tRNA(Arg) A34 adenosine deaminase TadA